jgi:3-oxoacyl-ACP reductase-like protein
MQKVDRNQTKNESTNASTERRGIHTRPAHAILPLSPNHGIFGNDGLYAESKLGLHALLHKWRSEAWRPYLSLAGAIIGWTRGTGLMSTNNIVAPGISSLSLLIQVS